jgi:hypothetical protein
MKARQTSSVFGSNVVPLFEKLPARPNVAELDPPWRPEVMKRLEALLRLPIGWDGYQGKPVALANVIFALDMLESICGYDVPAPQIVPGLNGDLQIEWHTLAGDVEFHVRAPNNVHAWRSLTGPVELEDETELTYEFSAVAAWVRDITELPSAAKSSAA